MQITATREASKISAGYCAGVLVLDEKYSHMALCMHQVLAQNQYPRRVAAPVRLRDFVFATARMRSRPNKTFRFTRLQPIRQQ